MMMLIGCSKDDECNLILNIPANFNQMVFADNINTIDNYLTTNNLSAQETSTGLHYIITEEGSTVKPELCDDVTVAYKGYLPNGTVFDQSEAGVSFPLTGVILGWQEGIQLFGQGGSGILLIPSYLAYGANPPSPLIPENSVLIFDVNLLSF